MNISRFEIYLDAIVNNKRNKLNLFDQSGRLNLLEINRHICSLSIDEIPGDSVNEKIINSIKATLYLWETWNLKIILLAPGKEIYSGIIIDDNWIRFGHGTPPEICINSIESIKIINNNDYKHINFDNIENDLKDILIKSGVDSNSLIINKGNFEDDNEDIKGGIFWRIDKYIKRL